jgi:spore germination protein YaaH
LPLLFCLPSSARPSRPKSKTVYAWFPARFGSWNTEGIPWDCLTHLCFRSVVLKADGSLELPAGDPPREFVDTAHRHGVKVTVLVWVNRAEDSDGYLANAPQKAVDNLLEYVRRNRLDGVNIDDERMRERNEIAGAPNRELVTRFFRLLSRTFRRANRSYHLSFAAPPVIAPNDRYGTSWMDLDAIASAVDAIIPMGYTMNPPSIGWSTNPEPLAGGGKGPRTTTRDLQTMLRDYLAAMGGRKEQLLPGVSLSFGGYEWRCRTAERLSPTIGRGVAKTFEECEAQARQHGKRWDSAQQSPWYAYPDGDAFIQGWYNDRGAWKAKLDWIASQGLGGIGLWVLDGVTDPPDRWLLLRDFLRVPASRVRPMAPAADSR